MSDFPMPIATATRRYRFQVVGLLLCYVVVLCISLRVLHHMPAESTATWLRVLVTLAPVVPVTFVLLAVIRLMSRVDELCRRLHLEAASLTTGVGAVLALTYGFLENVGVPPLSGFVVFMVLTALYGLFVCVLTLRYR